MVTHAKLFPISEYSKTLLIQFRFVWLPGGNTKNGPKQLTFLFASRYVPRKHYLSALTLSTSPNCGRMINFPVPRFHVKKKWCTLSRTVAGRRSSFPAVLAHPCHVKMAAHTVAYSGNSESGWSSQAAFTAITTNCIAISIFTYLCHRVCGVVLSKAHSTLLKDNPNALPFAAPGGAKWGSCFAMAASYSGKDHPLDFGSEVHWRLVPGVGASCHALSEHAKTYCQNAPPEEAADPGRIRGAQT